MDEAQKNTLIQQRIKKMMENKKKHALNNQSQHTKRLKSGTGTDVKVHQADTQQQLGKPHSSIRLRRPASAFKAVESTNAVVTPSHQKVEIDFKALLQTVFNHGVKLQQFLRQQRLDQAKYHEHLSNNQLFSLSAQSKLKQIPEEKHSAVLQKLTIVKITRDLQVRAQLQRCEQAQQRITQRLDDRIRMLSKKE